MQASRSPTAMVLAAACLCAVFAPLALAQTPATAPAPTQPPADAPKPAAVFGDCRLGYWSGNRNLDGRSGAGGFTCTAQARRTLDAWSMAASMRAGVNDHGDGQRAGGDLREAYVQWQSPAWRLRGGRRLIAWGRADRINPTDLLSGRDFTRLASDDEAQRLGTDALEATYTLNTLWSIQAVLARFRGNVLPEGALPPGRVPADRPKQPMKALKLERVGGDVDASVSWFDGHAASPSYRVEGVVTPTSLRLLGEHERLRAWGADAAKAVGRWNLRAEIARWHQTSDCGACTERERPSTRVVVGVDTDLGDSANVNVQWFRIARGRYVSLDDVPVAQRPIRAALDSLNSEFARHEDGLTLRWSARYLDDALTLEVAAILDLTHRGSLWRPRASYSFSDRLRLSVGWDRFCGPAHSFFGSRRANQLGFAEVVWVY